MSQVPSNQNTEDLPSVQIKQATSGDSDPIPEPKNVSEATSASQNENKEPVLPPKDLPFLAHDPYAADDDIIPFDKTKPIKPSRSGSVRSLMSTNSIQSLKRGFSSLKRRLTNRRTRRPRQEMEGPQRTKTENDADEVLGSLPRVGTLSNLHTFRGPKRVETFQVAAMAY